MATPLPPKTLVNRPLVDRCRPLAVIALMLVGAAGCSHKKEIEAAKRDAEKEMDSRASAAASAAVKAAMDQQQQERAERMRREADAKRAERDAVTKRPEAFLAASNVQTSKKGTSLSLASLSITNTSKYPMTDVRGTLELHGGDMADAGMTTDVIASIPIELSGSIAPGASMTFSADQKTIAGGAVQVKNAVDRVTFTVTGVKSIGGDTVEQDATKDGGL